MFTFKAQSFAKLFLLLPVLGVVIAGPARAENGACQELVSPPAYLLMPIYRPKAVSHGGAFVAPNEQNPNGATKILAAAPEGVYIAVGADRGFNNVARTPKATHLLLIDRDTCIVEFNVINLWLLAVSRDRSDYLHLRLKASAEEWSERAKQTPFGDDFAFLEYMQAPYKEDGERKVAAGIRSVPMNVVWNWWETRVRRSGGDFIAFHTRLPSLEEEEEFGESVDPNKTAFAYANYLYYDEQFDHVHRMAKAQRIAAVKFDLSEKTPAGTDRLTLTGLADAIRATKLNISVIDLSNAWWSSYIPKKKTGELVTALAPFTTKDSILLLTNTGWHWKYQGFRFSTIADSYEDPILLFNELDNAKVREHYFHNTLR